MNKKIEEILESNYERCDPLSDAVDQLSNLQDTEMVKFAEWVGTKGFAYYPTMKYWYNNILRNNPPITTNDLLTLYKSQSE